MVVGRRWVTGGASPGDGWESRPTMTRRRGAAKGDRPPLAQPPERATVRCLRSRRVPRRAASRRSRDGEEVRRSDACWRVAGAVGVHFERCAARKRPRRDFKGGHFAPSANPFNTTPIAQRKWPP